jgi:folylpolyglutamate synthase
VFDKAIFCTNITFKKEGYKDGNLRTVIAKGDLVSINTSAEDVTSLKVQYGLKQTWDELCKGSEAVVTSTIEEAVETIRSWPGEKEVFVTGSLHLIGGLYVVLDEGNRPTN